jgi:hypothetical protein
VRKDDEALGAGRVTKTIVETDEVAANRMAIGPHERGGELERIRDTQGVNSQEPNGLVSNLAPGGNF